MNICLLTSGKPEDADPLLALGLGLQEYGHRVLIAAPDHLQSYIRTYPLRYQALAQPFQQQWHASLIAASAQSDLLLCHPLYMFEAATLSELLQKPFMFAATSPVLPARLPSVSMLDWASRMTMPRRERQRWSSVNEWRTALGLRSLRSYLQRDLARLQVPFLHAYSAALAPMPKRPDTPHHYISGAIAWNRHPTSYASLPSRQAIEAWVGHGHNLVLFNLGRTRAQEVGRLAALAAEAARRLQLKVIIAADRSDDENREHDEQQSDWIRFVPCSGEYRWLHNRCRCIVHDGDAAITHAVLAAGIPSIILSADKDQAFWGNRIAEQQVGKHIPLSAVTTTKLIQALQALICDLAKARAEQLGARMKQEGGLRGALDWIVRMMPSAPIFHITDV